MAKITNLKGANKVVAEVGDIIIGSSGNAYMIIGSNHNGFHLVKLADGRTVNSGPRPTIEALLDSISRDRDKTVIKSENVEVILHG